MIDNLPTILLVEDDQFLQQMYATKLGREDLQVLIAGDGEKALLLISEYKVDVVLLDIIIPKKDGFAVLAEIRKNKNWKNLPVIMFSNLGEIADIKRSRELGATEYIIKSHFLPSEVVDMVKKYIKN